VLGALDYRTGQLEYDLHLASVTQKEVKDFLQRLAEKSDPKRTTVLILDNARIHHAISQEQLDIWLCDYGSCLWFLPTYSPELNLIELLWK
jgi:transposase